MKKEWAAIDGTVPMTQELFDSVMEKCTGSEFDAFIRDLLQKYPEYAKTYAERIEAELDTEPMPESWHEPTPEEDQADWKRLCTRIQERYRVNGI